MELYRIYRKNALRPWMVGGVALAAVLVYLLVAWRRDYSAIPLLLAVYLLPFGFSTFRVWTGSGAKGFQAYAAAHSPEEMKELEIQYEHGRKLGQAVLTDKYLVFMSRQHLDVLPYEDLVWAYQVGRITRIVGGTTYVTVLVTKDRRNYNIDIVGKEAELREYFAALQEQNPGIIVGQNKEISRMYKKDFDSLLRLVEERRGEAQSPSPQEQPEPDNSGDPQLPPAPENPQESHPEP